MSREIFERSAQLLDAGRVEEAARLLDGVLSSPDPDPNLVMLRARVYAQTGDAARAAELARHVVERFPAQPGFRTQQAMILALARDYDGAIEAYARALAEGMDGDAETHRGLASARNHTERFAESAAGARAALTRFPDHAPLSLELAHALAGLGRADEAVQLLLRLAPAHPAYRELHEGLAYFTNYTAGADPSLILHSHRHYGKIVAHHSPTFPDPPRPDPTPGRRLRVGFVSSDLGAHVVADFLAPLFEGLDRDRFELFAYLTLPRPADDPRRRRFEQLSTFRDVSALGHDDLARLIRRDRIDVVIETNGLTRGHVMPALARRAAPLQITYLGYPNTTGCPNIDVRLVDPLTDPPTADQFHSERLVRIAGCFVCYAPPADAPEVSDLPCLRTPDAPFTFGSFNNMRKITFPVLAAWARLLDAVPGSRIVVKSPQLLHDANGRDLVERFAQAGGDPSRLLLGRPVRSRAEHLRAYSAIDVALDTFPYCGTTTTCEALLMGVPVVSFAGQAERPRHCSRVGLSLLTAAGHPEWVACSSDQYVEIAQRLARDRAALASIRAGLRGELLRSSLCDARDFAGRFATALAHAWDTRV
jgi:predicted O-linked N-acetylglucosamine transferase (SPINDLY family)